MDFAATLRRTAAQHATRTAVSGPAGSRTYGQLWQRSTALAAALRSLGLAPGDRVATLGFNSVESVEIVCALAVAGMVRCPLYTQNVVEMHRYMLELVGARALIVDAEHVGMSAQLRATPGLENIIVVDAQPAVGWSYEGLVEQHADAGAPPPPNPEAPHVIRFSAGTTGRPKGIVHTCAGWGAMGAEFASVLPRLDEHDRYLAAGPLSHAAGLLVWPLIAAGVRLVVMPSFDAARFVKLVENEAVTISFLVPTMLQLIVNHPAAADADHSSLRAVLYGGAPASERTITDARALWGDVLYQMYGQSECPPVTCLTPAQHVLRGAGNAKERLRSAGRPTPRSVVTIRDEHGIELPVGAVGEVCVRSPATMSGIWGDDTATAQRFTHDGALRTRDVGHLDSDGYLFLADRIDDLIVSGGFNVWPAEVENALCGHPAVAEAAVVGVPHRRWGETVAAAVVLRPGCAATEQELIAWCRERVGPVRKPTQVVFADRPLPKSPVGKLLRRAVRARYWNGEQRQIHGA